MEEALDAPGAQQMGILRKIFEARPEWWLLVPDQSLRGPGGKTDGKVLHLAARTRTANGPVDLADKAKFSVDLGKLSAANFKATWINPVDGKRLDWRHSQPGCEGVYLPPTAGRIPCWCWKSATGKEK